MIRYLLLICWGWLLAGCTIMSTYQTAKPLPPGAVNLGVSADFQGINYENVDLFNFSPPPFVPLPILHADMRFGTKHQMDWGIRAGTNISLQSDLKIQVFGDQFSPWAGAAGLGLGGGISPNGFVGYGFFPVYLSKDLSEEDSLYGHLRYVGLFNFTNQLFQGGGHISIGWQHRYQWGNIMIEGAYQRMEPLVFDTFFDQAYQVGFGLQFYLIK